MSSIIDNALQALFNWSRRTLVWENASPTSTFDTQDITLDLSDCIGAAVIYRYSTADDSIVRHEGNVGETVAATRTFNIINNTGTIGHRSRSFDISADGIHFNNAVRKMVNDKEMAIENAYLIPVAIYKLGGAIANLLRRLAGRRCAVCQ